MLNQHKTKHVVDNVFNSNRLIIQNINLNLLKLHHYFKIICIIFKCIFKIYIIYVNLK